MENELDDKRVFASEAKDEVVNPMDRIKKLSVIKHEKE